MTYYYSPDLDSWHRQIILGTILGGASVIKPVKGRNCHLFMRSCHEAWITYKAKELDQFTSQKPFLKSGNTFRWHSNCYPIFNQFYDMFYKNKEKIIKLEVLDELRDIGLAIWFGDCGKIENNKVILNTYTFSRKSNKIICDWLALAQVDDSAKVITKNNRNRIILSESGSDKFLLTIAYHLPDFMHYKLK